MCVDPGHNPSCVDPQWDMAQRARAQQPAGGPSNNDMVPDFEPLFMQYGVDVYASGHIHDYEFIYPTYNNTRVQTDFINPRAPVVILRNAVYGQSSASTVGCFVMLRCAP